MCGIVGYIGGREAQGVLLKGLKRLEYRGYDSAGISVFAEDRKDLVISKLPGKVSSLERVLDKSPLAGGVGIGHSRWATHGPPSEANAHPHTDCKGDIAVVHNGIIENFAGLKKELARLGHRFKSQTDTEVIAHLVEGFHRNLPLEEAVRKTVARLEGSFAIAVMSKKEPDKLVGARVGSPLIAGAGSGENFLASDAPAILEFTRDVVFLDEGEMALLTKDHIVVKDFKGAVRRKTPTRLNWSINQAEKGGYKHFMLKEINEQPAILEKILKVRAGKDERGICFEEQKIPDSRLKGIDKISIVACGTAYHAGLVAKYAIESICKIPVAVEVSSEFRYGGLMVDKKTLVIAISQSGETADTLAGVKAARQKGSTVLSICNVLGSSLTRESDGVIYTYAGPEIGVASTKAYTAQIATLYLFAFYLAGILGRASNASSYLAGLRKVPALQARILKSQEDIARLARRYAHFGTFLYLGRNINYPSALEGALKLKEISYIPAEGYAAGEMKHGPIALIDEYRAVVCVAPSSHVYGKMVSNIQEIKARKGRIIAIVSEANRTIQADVKELIRIPDCDELFSPLLVALPLQLVAYHIADKRGCDVDQPRNLAKSVTVE